MAALDRLKRDSADDEAGSSASGSADSESGFTDHPDRTEEDALRARLSEDPNDVPAFDRLARIVRTRAAEGHDVGDPQREADDAVWALAEEVARSGQAWYPLIELARLSVDDDREAALRRLGTAAERDASGQALASGLAMLREAGHPVEALNLGVGHWRPREHVVDAGRELIEASIEAGRSGEARRQLDALAAHPDTRAVEKMRRELEKRIDAVEQARPARRTAGDPPFGAGAGPTAGDPPRAPGPTAGGSGAAVDVRDNKGSRLLGFLRR